MLKLKSFIPTFSALAIVLLLPTAARAHRVNIWAEVKDGNVHTESFTPDGAPCKDCKIEVLDESGKVLLTGKTDDKGKFSFAPPAKCDLTIVLNAGMGHRAECKLKADELPDSSPQPQAQKPESEIQKPTRPEGPTVAQAIAGIGYIVGIVGIVAYIRARQIRKRGGAA